MIIAEVSTRMKSVLRRCRGLRWHWLFRRLSALTLAFVGWGGSVLSAPAPSAPEPAPRLGIYHASPRLCLGDEPSQRDLRVLRLAFGLARSPAQRMSWPWYFRAQPTHLEPQGRVLLALDTVALWNLSPYRLLGVHPDFPINEVRDRLALWREQVIVRVPSLVSASFLSIAQLEGPSPLQDPFLPSRLAQSRLLPFTAGLNGAAAGSACRHWPSGVILEPGTKRLAYRLRRGQAKGGGPFLLSAYRTRPAMWRDYLRGRLDALLLEGDDFQSALRRLRSEQLGTWGELAGTQQLLLRPAPALAGRLSIEQRQALSMSLPRGSLAQLDKQGRFAPVRAFLAPVLQTGQVEDTPLLRRDSLSARRLWLKSESRPDQLRLAVLAHPFLERLAQRVREQWRKTLNLTLEVEVLTVDQFYRVIEQGEADMALEVADLDNGSLQDLWLAALRAAGASLDHGPPQWEAALRNGLPYLPLIGNVHHVLLRRHPPPGLLQRVCPGCRETARPRRLAPKAVERLNPQG